MMCLDIEIAVKTLHMRAVVPSVPAAFGDQVGE